MRPAGQMKAGFYPTPDNVVKALRDILDLQPGCRILDNCCGEGMALHTLTWLHAGKGIENFIIEYDPERFEKASQRFKDGLCCDAIDEAVISHQGFGLCWLNPPYDWESGDVDQAKDRLEIRFLKRTHPYIQDGGVLVYIIPFASIKKAKGLLVGRLENLRVFPFAKADYDRFKQAVVIGTYRYDGVSDDTKAQNKDYLDMVLSVPVEDAAKALPAVGSPHFRKLVYEVPKAVIKKESLKFRSSRFDADIAFQSIQHDGVMDRFDQNIEPRDIKSMHPLAPLRDGHTGMLILGGYMNGEVVKGDLVGLINGIVGKESKITEVAVGEESTTVKETERFKNSILFLDLMNAELLEVQ